jgi:hypothetical protein
MHNFINLTPFTEDGDVPVVVEPARQPGENSPRAPALEKNRCAVLRFTCSDRYRTFIMTAFAPEYR